MSDTKHNTREPKRRTRDSPTPSEYPFGNGGVYNASDEADSSWNMKKISVYSVPRAKGKTNRRWHG